MKKFKTQFDPHDRRHAEPGSQIHKTFSGSYDEKGRVVLTPTGEENIYNKIQSHKLSCDINHIVKRFTNGEVDVLSKVQGFYGDFRGMPSNYAQMLNTVESGRRLFESLPVEQREVFNHSFEQFMVSIDDGTLISKLGLTEENVHGKENPAPAPEE